MTVEELKTVRRLLNTGTSNALIPADRRRWSRERDEMVQKITDEVGR